MLFTDGVKWTTGHCYPLFVAVMAVSLLSNFICFDVKSRAGGLRKRETRISSQSDCCYYHLCCWKLKFLDGMNSWSNGWVETNKNKQGLLGGGNIVGYYILLTLILWALVGGWLVGDEQDETGTTWRRKCCCYHHFYCRKKYNFLNQDSSW